LIDFTIDLIESFLSPIEHIVVFESSGFKQVSEETIEIYVVRFISEIQRPDIIDVCGEFIREDILVELFSKKLHFLLLD